MFDDIRNDVDKLVKFKQISMELLFSFSFGEIEAKLHRVFTNKIWLLYVFDREGLCAIKIWLPVLGIETRKGNKWTDFEGMSIVRFTQSRDFRMSKKLISESMR